MFNVRVVGDHEIGCECFSCVLSSAILGYTLKSKDDDDYMDRIGDIFVVMLHNVAQLEVQLLRAGASAEEIQAIKEATREDASQRLKDYYSAS